MGSSTWDQLGQACCQVRPEDSLHPERPALTQVGRAHSLVLEAPPVSSPLEKLRSGALHSGLASSVLRLPQGWEGPRLGGVTSRYPLARGRVSLGTV